MNTADTSSPLACLLILEGPDAIAFAHAQFTSDVRALEKGAWQWSAWLDARGRVQALFHLARVDDNSLVALLRGGDATTMAERLRRFVFRSRVTLTARAAAPVGGGEPLPAFHIDANGDAVRLGLGDRSLVFPAPAAGTTDWRLQAIRHGEPWLPGALLDTFLPPALGLRRLGAVSLDKGCYPGQEIAARLHYRGGHKHALVHLRLDAPVTPGGTGTDSPADPDDDAPDMQVLECVAVDGAYEALAVMHERALPSLRTQAQDDGHAPLLLRRFDP